MKSTVANKGVIISQIEVIKKNENFEEYSIKNENEIFTTPFYSDFVDELRSIDFATATITYGEGMMNIIIWNKNQKH
ncbi:hypothetical protein [Bacteroides eggerthii]|uniref:hypothetical protein n=1 Tax=Bacteroides eggerthii TaxID=28111 RepID=UPI00189D9DC6|nr:hypothetical protein [Bacteroides eggerthii]